MHMQTSVLGKCSVTTLIRIFSIQNGSSRPDQVPEQRLPKGLPITLRQGDMDVRLYCTVACMDNGKVIIEEC